MQNLIPPRLFVIIAAVMVVFALFSSGFLASLFSVIIGAAIIGIGLALAFTQSQRFAGEKININTFREPGALLTNGAYARTRNPMYLGMFLALLGLALVLVGPWVWLGPVAFFAAADRWYIPHEEEAMSRRFGADYDAYRQRVRRWI